MKKFLFAAAATVAICAPALAADTHLAWQGFFTVTANTTACAGIGGTGVGDTEASIYRPGFTATDISSMNILYSRAAFNLTNVNESANPQMRGNGTATVRAMNGKGKAFTYTTTYSNIVTTPATITAATTAVKVTGTVNNVWNTAGCNVTFKASYAPRID